MTRSKTDAQNESPPLQHFRRNLPLLLLQAREAVLAPFRPLLAEAGVTEQQWRILRALLPKGKLEPREIGTMCCISSASLAGILARMDEMGLVERVRLAHDQRRVHVSVTRKGETLVKQLAPQIERTYVKLESLVGLEAANSLYAALDQLLSKLEAI